ncbi:MAG: glycoside hydrolase family 3 N-terminal domain-containing protein [Terricaulis sp.]
MENVSGLVTAVIEWLQKTLRGPLAVFQFVLAALVVFAIMTLLVGLVLAVRDVHPLAFFFALIIFGVASLFAGIIAFLAWRRAKLKITRDPAAPIDEQKEERRKRQFWVISGGWLAGIVLCTTPLVYFNLPRLAQWYYELSFQFMPDPEVRGFQQLIGDLEQNRTPRDALFTLVDELFVLGPADPLVISESDAEGDLSRFAIKPLDANVGTQLFSSVRAGGLFFRPSSFALLAGDRDHLTIAGSRLNGREAAAAWIGAVRQAHGGLGAIGSTPPLLVFADHEGGIGSSMEQLSPIGVSYVSELPAPMAMSVGRSRANACIAGFLAGRDLRRLGVDVDFAPVMDIAANVSNQVVHDRSFSTDINVVTPMGLAFYDGMTFGGVSPVLKHFPGHSRTPAGAERSQGIKQSSYDPNLLDALLEPFRTVIATRHPDFVMSANFSAPGLGLPVNANIAHSPKFMRDLLRGAGGGDVIVNETHVRSARFDGVLVSDDLLQRSYLFDTSERLTLDEFPQRVADNATALLDAGHDMLLLGEVRASRPSSARFIVGYARTASEEPAYLTIAEVAHIRDLVRAHIFDAGHPERVERFRQSLIRIFHAKLNALHRRASDHADYQFADSDVANGVAQSNLTRIWNESFGYVFRGPALNLSRPPSTSGGHILVTPMGSGSVNRPRAAGRLTTAGEAGWLAQSGSKGLMVRQYSRISPVTMEFVRTWGAETRLLPLLSDHAWRDCRAQGMAALGLAAQSEAAATPAEASPPPAETGADDPNAAPTIPVSLELLSRDDTLEAPQTRFREPLEVRRQCLDKEGEALADAIASELHEGVAGRSIVFVITDIKSYQAALFALWHLRVLEQRVHQPGLYLQRTLLVFDWESLLTLLPNEFGISDDDMVTPGDAEILKDVSMFFPFSGYEDRALRAVRFLTDPGNQALIASKARTRLPMPVPGNEIPFSVSDAFDGRTCAEILAQSDLAPRLQR